MTTPGLASPGGGGASGSSSSTQVPMFDVYQSHVAIDATCVHFLLEIVRCDGRMYAPHAPVLTKTYDSAMELTQHMTRALAESLAVGQGNAGGTGLVIGGGATKGNASPSNTGASPIGRRASQKEPSDGAAAGIH